jgi:hypothetical protein
MSPANPKVEPLFGLQPQTVPRVRAEAGHVIVRLELVSLRDPLDVRDMEIALSDQYASKLGFELIENAKKLG